MTIKRFWPIISRLKAIDMAFDNKKTRHWTVLQITSTIFDFPYKNKKRKCFTITFIKKKKKKKYIYI